MTAQSDFAAALLDPDVAAPDGLVAWNGSDPAHRFAVYRNNVTSALSDVLADSFPVTQQLVGEAFFRALAQVFVRAHPPRTRVLAHYGHELPEFVAQFPPAAGLPYLADVARLEWQRLQALHAELQTRVLSLGFNLGDENLYTDFTGDGEWTQESPQRGVWQPAKGKAKLTYRVRINHERSAGRYDARMTEDWALLRGDDLVPAVQLRQKNDTELVARLKFDLPKGWKSVETGWPRIGTHEFRIDNPQRKFDRPTGWIIAGKIGTRRAKLGDSDVTIAAPVGEGKPMISAPPSHWIRSCPQPQPICQPPSRFLLRRPRWWPSPPRRA